MSSVAPVVAAMPREPGRSAIRYTHLLYPEDEIPAAAPMSPAQRAAAESETPALVIAGPGTGKTSTLVARVAYLALERNRVVKDWNAAAVRLLLAFPDEYGIGMSHQGTRILYHIANSRPSALAERAFAPWPDMAAAMRAASSSSARWTRRPARGRRYGRSCFNSASRKSTPTSSW